MKKLTAIILAVLLLLCGCAKTAPSAQVVATTQPVYEFTQALCKGTDITVAKLITERVSCLHEYTLQVPQMRMIESAELIVLSGAGLEDFLEDALASSSNQIDASAGITLLQTDGMHEADPHIWLSPVCARKMAQNICDGLCEKYPAKESVFRQNLGELTESLEKLQEYGENALKELSSRELITFHDGFAYFAQAMDLNILASVEEEPDSEVSASKLRELISLVETHDLPAVFTEVNGSANAADILHTQTGVRVYTLDTSIGGDSYFDAMYRNIDTVKEALG